MQHAAVLYIFLCLVMVDSNCNFSVSRKTLLCLTIPQIGVLLAVGDVPVTALFVLSPHYVVSSRGSRDELNMNLPAERERQRERARQREKVHRMKTGVRSFLIEVQVFDP